MGKNPLISVVVPIYNVKEYLEQCIDSIRRQTYNNLEIILVDDGSTDGSASLCDEYAKMDSRIKVIHKVNGGLADARNAGVEIAQGEYIGFVDSDDYIDDNMYEILINLCNEYGVSVSCVRWKSFGNKFNDPKTETGDVVKMSSGEYLEAMLYEKKKYYISISVCDRLYKREIVENLKFPTGKYYEDIVYSTQALIIAKECVFMDASLYHYRIRENSISDKTRKKGIDANKFEHQLDQEVEQIEILEKNGLNELADYLKYTAYKECLRFYAVCKEKRGVVTPCIRAWESVARSFVKVETKKDNWLRVRLALLSLELYGLIDGIWLRLRGKA